MNNKLRKAVRMIPELINDKYLTDEQILTIGKNRFIHHKLIDESFISKTNGFDYDYDYVDDKHITQSVLGINAVRNFQRFNPHSYNKLINSINSKIDVITRINSVLNVFKGLQFEFESSLAIAATSFNTSIYWDQKVSKLFENVFGVKTSDSMLDDATQRINEDANDRAKRYLDFEGIDPEFTLDIALELTIYVMYKLGLFQGVGLRRTRPLTIKEAAESLPTSSNPCWPMNRGTKEQDRDRAIKEARKLLSVRQNGKLPVESFLALPAIAFTRRNVALNFSEEEFGIDIDNKKKRDRVKSNQKRFTLPDDIAYVASRIIWGTPHSIMIIEAMMIRPILKIVQSLVDEDRNGRVAPMAIGVGHGKVGKVVDQKRSQAHKSGNPLISLDYRRYDSTIPYIFHVLYWSMIETVNIDTHFINHDTFNAMFAWSLFTPYIFDGNNSSHFMRRGNVSGQVSTSLFNSFVNLVLINYCVWTHSGHVLSREEVTTLGDDNLFVAINGITIDYIVKVISRFKMKLAPEKCDTYYDVKNDDIKYLGFIWKIDPTKYTFGSYPYQTLGWAMGRCVFPERFLSMKKIGTRPIWIERIISVFAHIHGGWRVVKKLLSGNEIFKHIISCQEHSILYVGPNLEKQFYTVPVATLQLDDCWRWM